MNIMQENTARNHLTDEQLALIKRLGRPVSSVLLYTPCNIFQSPRIEGLIGYQLFNNCAVVIGDPVCMAENLNELTEVFHLFCRERSHAIIYFLASETFAHWAITQKCRTLIQVGEELIIDPMHFEKRQKLRWKINQSIHHGVIIKEYQNNDLTLKAKINEVMNAWAKAKQGPQIYLGKLDVFASYAEKRIFYAELGGTILGLLLITRMDRFKGWVTTSFFSLKEAPAGLSEHLMCAVLETLANEECHFLCLGAISGSKLGEIIGLNRCSAWFAHSLFKIARWLFNLDARKIYLNKYHPCSQPAYVLFSGKLTFHELLALKKTLNIKL